MKLKIAPKILLALLLSNVIVIVSMSAYLRWSFEQGFLDYLHQIEIEQIAPLQKELSKLHKGEEGWNELSMNNQLWHQTLVKALPDLAAGLNRPKSRLLPNKNQKPGERKPPAQARRVNDPFKIIPRLSLIDITKNNIIGNKHQFSNQDTYLPVSTSDGIVGWLVFSPSSMPMNNIAKRFNDQQFNSLVIIAVLALLFSLLVAILLTRNLTRPIKALAKGTNALTSGNFNSRIPVSSSDELGQLAEDFNHLAMTLENNEQSRRQWVADISHELRTPLAVLRGEIEAMQDGIREVNDERLASLHAEVLNLGKLVEDIYQLSLSDIGALKYQKTIVTPAFLLEDVVESFHPRFESKQIKLSFQDFNKGKATILADPTRLTQLFSNLLENSFRYTDQGGEVSITIKLDNHCVVFTFDDSHPGVSDEAISRLFDRLYRADASRTRSTGGAGLGLSICNNIVKAHQGEISASHSEKGGVTFSIKLPLAKGETR